MKRQAFSNEFKREAVRLLEQDSKEASQLARELGVKRNELYKWQSERRQGRLSTTQICLRNELYCRSMRSMSHSLRES